MFNPILYPVQEDSGITLIGDQIKLKSLLKLKRSVSQVDPYTFYFPSAAGTTGQALFWSGSETTFRGIAIADVATLQTSLNTINATLASLGTAAFQATSYFALSGHAHSDATTSVSGFLSGADKTKIDSLGTAAFQATSYFALSGHTHSDATTSVSGFLSGADKTKINNLGTVYDKNTGTTNGSIPLIGAGDKLSSSIIPDISSTTSDSFTINSDAANTGSDRSIILARPASQSSSYSLVFPTASGTANQALIISSISGSAINLGWGNSGSGFSSVSSFTTTSISLNLSNGTMIAITLNGNVTISSITGIPSGLNGVDVTLLITQDSTGGRTLTYPGGTTVTGTISSSANSTSIVKLLSWDGGTTWNAVVVKPTGTTTTYWTPANITTGAWWDASDSASVAIGTGISQINDKSGNSRHATQSTASSQPSYITSGLNSRNLIRFDGSNDYLSFSGSFLSGNAYLIIGVFARSSTKSDNFILGGSTSNTNQNLHAGWSNNTTLAHNQYFNDYNATVSGYSSIEYAIFSFEKTASGSAIYKNGTSVATSGDTTYLTGYSGSAIGSRQDINAYFQGDFCELTILVGANATSANRILNEGYYAHKWINSLSSGHAYKNSPPTI